VNEFSNSRAFKSDTEKLAAILGEAIWAFSKIERMTYEYLKALSVEPLHHFMQGVSFSGRLAVIKQLILRIENYDAPKTSALGALKEADALAKTRNLIAHNPWSISINFTTKDLDFHIEKVTDQTVQITYNELEKFIADCNTLHDKFEHALAQLPPVWNTR
jgi:hypothetical protein